jgi:AcrR family transcriptional regulator
MTSQAADHRRATAERNVAAILDAAAELLSQPGAASIAAVAARAGVSRVTVYAHFPTWEALLEAVVERAVGHTTAVLASADCSRGDGDDRADAGVLLSMPTRLVHLVVDAADPVRLARFWAGALGWEVASEEPDEVDVCPPGFRYPDPSALPLVFVPVPEPKKGKNRVHLDLATESVAHQAAEVERLLALGAVPADIGQGDVPWTVLADPQGSEFCVLSPR